MSNTPDTDANQIFLGLNPDEGDYFVPAEIARKLEQQRDWYKAACDKYSEDETINTLCSLKEQRDRLAETASKLTHYIKKARAGDSPSIHYFIISSIDDAILKMDKALAAVKGGSDE